MNHVMQIAPGACGIATTAMLCGTDMAAVRDMCRSKRNGARPDTMRTILAAVTGREWIMARNAGILCEVVEAHDVGAAMISRRRREYHWVAFRAATIHDPERHGPDRVGSYYADNWRVACLLVPG